MNLGGTILHLNKTGIGLLCSLLFIFVIYSLSNSQEKSDLNIVNLNTLLRVAIKAAENGGEAVIKTKDNLLVKSKGLTKEGLQDSVTTADFLSHCTMMETLRHFYPSLKIISEEAKTICTNNTSTDYSLHFDLPDIPNLEVNARDVTVWIDPLDATHEYTEKLYKYVTTMVCIAVRGEPIIGVIYKPFSKKLSWGWDGRATSKDLEMGLANRAVNDRIKIIVSRSHQGEIMKVLQQNFRNFDLVIAAGAGYKALEVATKNVDAYLHITAIKKWDICAGNAILNALGGKMTDKYGNVVDYANDYEVKNEEGLIATLENHNMFVEKL